MFSRSHNEAGHFFLCICRPFSANYLFISLAHFSSGLFTFFLFIWGSFKICRFIQETFAMYVANIVSLPISCPCLSEISCCWWCHYPRYPALSSHNSHRCFCVHTWVSLGTTCSFGLCVKGKCWLRWDRVSAVSNILIRTTGLFPSCWHLLLAGWWVTFITESDGHRSPSLLWEGCMGNVPSSVWHP